MVFDDDDSPFKEIMYGGQMKNSGVTPQSQESTFTTLDLKIRTDSGGQDTGFVPRLIFSTFITPVSNRKKVSAVRQ
mgnify:FL=1